MEAIKTYLYLIKRVLTVSIKEVGSADYKDKPEFKGKFFYVSPCREDLVFKNLVRIRRPNVILDLTIITIITILLERNGLTPRIHSIYISPFLNNFSICVGKAENILTEADRKKYNSKLLSFFSNIVEVAERWKIKRFPYEDYPYDDTFLLEINNIDNLGIFREKLVLLDIDPKCHSDSKLVKFANFILKSRIYIRLRK